MNGAIEGSRKCDDPCRKCRNHSNSDKLGKVKYQENGQGISGRDNRAKVAAVAGTPGCSQAHNLGHSKECLPAQHNFAAQHNFVAYHRNSVAQHNCMVQRNLVSQHKFVT